MNGTCEKEKQREATIDLDVLGFGSAFGAPQCALRDQFSCWSCRLAVSGWQRVYLRLVIELTIPCAMWQDQQGIHGEACMRTSAMDILVLPLCQKIRQ